MHFAACCPAGPRLRGRPRIHFFGLSQTPFAATAEWYRAYYDGGRVVTREQLTRFVGDARSAGATWVQS